MWHLRGHMISLCSVGGCYYGTTSEGVRKWDGLLADLEWQGDGLRGEFRGDRVKDIDIECAQDVIAGEVLQGGADDQLVGAGRPGAVGSETPFGFTFGDRDRTGNSFDRDFALEER